MKRMGKLVIAGFIMMAIAITGLWLDFQNIPALKWEIQDEKLYEGFSWLSNNTKEGETVLAWWDYADGIAKIGHREVVIKEASRSIKDTIAGRQRYPWSWIEYELWYPYEAEDKVRDVASFFIAENSSESLRIAGKYGVDYVLVVYPVDLWKFYAIVRASGKEPGDYLTEKITFERLERREILKRETVGTKMICGDDVAGFEKVFDNGAMRIYRLK